MSEFRSTTRDIIKLTEQVSGFPVVVQPEPRLSLLGAMRAARGNQPGHVVFYKPYIGTQPDYVICHQCGYILRKFLVPPADMVDMGPDEQGRAAVRALVESGGIATGEEQIASLTDGLLSGVLTQLLSVPVGLRIAEWLHQEYPDLHELQVDYAEREIREAKEILRRKIREVSPPPIYYASVTMNAAVALHWAELLRRPGLGTGWPAENEAKAKELLVLWHDLPEEPEHDRALIDRWGEELGLRDWYSWVPYRRPA
ncbi:MAG: hypothetical protein GX657_11100 [Chloroflexi bacterium]|nr:hypothetical protein [Chloroflexota bacterium]